jgi:transposase
MPTVPRCPAAHQQRQRLEARRLRAAELLAAGVIQAEVARRLRAAELLAAGVIQAEVARQLGVSRQSVSDWHARWQHGGIDALRSRGPTGPNPRVSDAQLAQVERTLLEGAATNGVVGELWTLARIALVIERLTGIRHHPATCGRCCATGSAGPCNVPGAARPSATRTPSTSGSRKKASMAAASSFLRHTGLSVS